MTEHILFVTGKLAEPALRRILAAMEPGERTYDIRQLGISVAALMTAEMIRRRLDDPGAADRIVVPGHCRGDLQALSQHLGVTVERGPKELKDLPEFLGGQAQTPDLSHYDVQIFAELVDAPNMSLDAILERAGQYRDDGADVIDVGCLPSTPFPHLEDAVRALREAGFAVSVDSMDADELLRGGRAGAEYLLSLTEDTLWLAQEVASTPILIPSEAGGLESLYRALEAMENQGRRALVDPILDPIHAGFTDSLVRYHTLRARAPQAEIMMGTGNLTELTHADTAGNTALLMGVCSELRIGHILTTEVSPHCRTVVRECNLARRIMCAARADNTPPRSIDEGLLALHERKPFPYNAEEIAEQAEAIKDPNFRIQISEEGLHVYNRDGLHRGQEPFELYPKLGVADDGAHAFYLGAELARAQIAWQLGKHYSQDEELTWGFAVAQPEEDLQEFPEEGPTLKSARERMRETRRRKKT